MKNRWAQGFIVITALWNVVIAAFCGWEYANIQKQQEQFNQQTRNEVLKQFCHLGVSIQPIKAHNEPGWLNQSLLFRVDEANRNRLCARRNMRRFEKGTRTYQFFDREERLNIAHIGPLFRQIKTAPDWVVYEPQLIPLRKLPDGILIYSPSRHEGVFILLYHPG